MLNATSFCYNLFESKEYKFIDSKRGNGKRGRENPQTIICTHRECCFGSGRERERVCGTKDEEWSTLEYHMNPEGITVMRMRADEEWRGEKKCC